MTPYEQKRPIPHLKNVHDFYRQLRIGEPQNDEFSIMRIEDQPETKRLEMPLFRGDFYRVVYLKNSGVEWNLPEQQFQASEYCIYFSYPGKLESWLAKAKNYGFLVCFTEDFARLDPLKASFSQDFPFFNFEAESLLYLTANEADELGHRLEAMLREANSPAMDRKEMLHHMLHQYLIVIKRIYLKNATVLHGSDSRASVYNRFRKAVDGYFTELALGSSSIQASVSLIAERLNLHASYLNYVIKELTGSTASHYIYQKTVLEAKSYLLHTDLQIAEISYRLGFTNVSYFHRFFKRHTGHTPLAYKRENKDVQNS